MRIILKYFIDVNLFNIIYSILVGVIFLNPKYIPICFGSCGTFLGFLSYNYFYKNEYFFYFNLGYSKKKLFKIMWILNLIISIITFLIVK
jgi:hypothetical protein